MRCHWQTSILAIALMAGLVHPLPAQVVSRDNIAATIERAVHDTELVSPISGIAVHRDALRLVGELITAQTADARLRMSRALSQSEVKAAVMDDLLDALSGLGTEQTAGRVQAAEAAFNTLVNLANPSFLIDPPPEFLALHVILLRVANASAISPRPGT